jgi:predicted ArsR family transcriptional regulator
MPVWGWGGTGLMATDFNTRQTVALESDSRKKIYDYLCDGIEPATVDEIASELDQKTAGVLYDLRVLGDVELVERIPAEGAGRADTFKAVER